MTAMRSKVSALEQIPNRVLLPTQHHTTVAVAVRHEQRPRIQAGLGQNSERDLDRPVLAKSDFRRLSDHRFRMPRRPPYRPRGDQQTVQPLIGLSNKQTGSRQIRSTWHTRL